jgi:ferrous iron transport protein A
MLHPSVLSGHILPQDSPGKSIPPALTLDRAPLGATHAVAALAAPANAPEWARWLEEIGFIPGEQVVLMARAALGGDPLVVRIGQSTFALRRAEAACVHLKAAA